MRTEINLETGEILELEDATIVKISSEDAEKQRIIQIKTKTGEIITSKYSMIWQMNHPRLDTTYTEEYAWIDNKRDISNKAELEGTALEDIDWGV
jgi:hypothetical protein